MIEKNVANDSVAISNNFIEQFKRSNIDVLH